MANTPWNTENTALQNLLKALRLESGLTQDELASKLGKPQSYVSKYESGERRIDYIEVKALCSEMGITVADFDKKLENTKQP